MLTETLLIYKIYAIYIKNFNSWHCNSDLCINVHMLVAIHMHLLNVRVKRFQIYCF